MYFFSKISNLFYRLSGAWQRKQKRGCPAGQLLNGKLKLVNRGYQTILDESIAHVLVQ